ncbi:MAG: hypothetical protein WDW36_007104 [Sanguina aurantia]
MLKNPNRESRRAGAGPGAGGISWDESNLEANEVIKAGLSSVRINEPKTPYHGPLDPLDPDHMDHDEGLQPLTLDDSHSMNGGRWGSQPAGPPSFISVVCEEGLRWGRVLPRPVSPLFRRPAQDLLLSILREDERIMLAPNSSQVPPLMPTQQNVFNPGVGPADGHQGEAAEAVTGGGREQAKGTVGPLSPAMAEGLAAGQGVQWSRASPSSVNALGAVRRADSAVPLQATCSCRPTPSSSSSSSSSSTNSCMNSLNSSKRNSKFSNNIFNNRACIGPAPECPPQETTTAAAAATTPPPTCWVGGDHSGSTSVSRSSVGQISGSNLLDPTAAFPGSLSVGPPSRDGDSGSLGGGSSSHGGGAAGGRGRGPMEDGGTGEAEDEGSGGAIAPPVMMTVGGRRPRSSDLRHRAYANGHDSELGPQHGHMEGGDGDTPAPHEMTEAQHAHFAAARKSHYNMREAMKRARKEEEEEEAEEMGSDEELGREADRHS